LGSTKELTLILDEYEEIGVVGQGEIRASQITFYGTAVAVKAS
jgi:hypothetical protein